MASPVDLLERWLRRNDWRKAAEFLMSSLAGTGFGKPGGAVTTTSASGATRNTLDDGSGNAIFSANVTVDGVASLLGGIDVGVIQSPVTTYVTVPGDLVILADATSGAFTVTVSGGVLSTPYLMMVKKIDSSGHTITVAPDSGNIDGAASISLSSQNESVILVHTHLNWWVLAANTGAIV